MAKKKTILDLGARERQVMEAVLRLGEGSVGDISNAIPDSPGVAIVRATLGELVRKELLEFWNVKNRYYYRPKTSVEKEKKSVLREIMTNLFSGRANEMAVTLFDVAEKKMSLEELEELSALIEEARQKRIANEKEKRK